MAYLEQVKVEVGCGNETEERFCSQDILKRACPTLHDEIEKFRFDQSTPIRIHGSPATFDAAILFLMDSSIENLHLDEFRAIEFLDFALKYQSPELQKAAEPLCQQVDFANMHAISLLNYHSTFLTYKLWTGIEIREKELLEEISRRGAEVLYDLSESKIMCFDTVKKILQQPRLNVFREKAVFDCINEWRNNIAKAVEENEYGEHEFVKFDKRWKEELVPLIRFEFFTTNEVHEFLYVQSSPLGDEEKKAIVDKNPSLNIGPNTNLLYSMLSVIADDLSLRGSLNLEYLSQWRGNFIPFTERMMHLPPEDEKKRIYDAEQTLNFQPLKRDLYLLSVRLYNLQGLYHNPETQLLSFSVAVIREEGKKIVSETNLTWRNGQSKYFMLRNPCLLERGQNYRVKVTNLERQLEIQTFYQPACDGQESGNFLKICGSGNIDGLSFAFAK